MRRLGFLASSLLSLAIACGTRPRPARIVAPPVTIRSGPAVPKAAWFGTWNDETEKFDRKVRFDRSEGDTFGWRLKIECAGPVKFREVMRLPGPGDWTFEPEDMPGTTISDDQTTTTTIDYAACKQGWVEHVWSIAAGDPVGTYVITVEIDGYAAQTFRPKFVEPDR